MQKRVKKEINLHKIFIKLNEYVLLSRTLRQNLLNSKIESLVAI